MSKYKQLANLVKDGMIRIIDIDAIPRSVSTALGRALAESNSPSIYINEPFNHMRQDIEEASGNILDELSQVVLSKNTPFYVITKNMARNIKGDLFIKWTEICYGVLWIVRRPDIQIGSLITRLVNDIEFEPGEDKIKQSDLTEKQTAKAVEFLDNSEKSKNFSKIGWQDLYDHFSQRHQIKRYVVVDGDDFTKNPEAILIDLCQLFGLKYSKMMLSGWKGRFINKNVGYSENYTDCEHAWIKDAVNSNGVTYQNRKPIDSSLLSNKLITYIEQVANPIYIIMKESIIG